MNKPKLEMPEGCNLIEIINVEDGSYGVGNGVKYEVLYGWKSMDSFVPEDACTRLGE